MPDYDAPPSPGSRDEGPHPEMFGDFELLREIGRGGSAIVYLARQVPLDRLVALKILPQSPLPSPKAIERFRREAAAVAQLHHPHIIPIHSFDTHQGVHFMAMEYVPGTSLDKLLAALKDERPEDLGADSLATHVAPPTIADEPLPPTSSCGAKDPHASKTKAWDRSHLETCCRIGAEIASALHTAHENNIFHRDVKPSNILVDAQGRALLMDFGLAYREGDVSLTQTGEHTGTPLYMAPEQVEPHRHILDHRCDIYALGITLYEMTTLQFPYARENLYHQIVNKQPVSPRKLNPHMSRDLDTILTKALEKNPHDRYASAAEMEEDLRLHLSLLPIRARRVGPVRRTFQLVRRHRMMSTVLSGSLILLITLMGLLTHSRLSASAKSREQRDHEASVVAQAHRALEDRSLAEADLAVKRLSGINQSHPELESLFARTRELEAQIGMDEAQGSIERYRVWLQLTHSLEKDLEEAHERLNEEYVPIEERAGILSIHNELDRKRDKATRLFIETNKRLQQLRGLGADHDRRIDGLLYELTKLRFDETRRRREESASRILAYRLDELRPELDHHEGEGALSLTVTPPSAAISLFRYEPLDKQTGTWEPRLAPFPVDAQGKVFKHPEWETLFTPGQICGLIDDVEPDSPLGDRLAPGDLILRLDGLEFDQSIFVTEVAPGSLAEDAAVLPLYRVASFDGKEDVPNALWDFLGPAGDEDIEVVFEGEEDVTSILVPRSQDWREASGVRLRRGEQLFPRMSFGHDWELTCLLGDRIDAITVPAGVPSGLHVTLTSTPLPCSEENTLDPGSVSNLHLPSGSYLALIRAEGFVDLRVPFVIARDTTVSRVANLTPTSNRLSDFVQIPEGDYEIGGDLEAYRPFRRRRVRASGFWIQKKETTFSQWKAFTESSFARDIIDHALVRGQTVLIPRLKVIANGDVLPHDDPSEPSQTRPQTPVFGITHDDALMYVAWRNAQAQSEGLPWRFDLPSEIEWEIAARGADSRFYPWGNRFDPSFCNGLCARPLRERYESTGSYPFDESPFGVRDLCGSVREWMAQDPNRSHHARNARGGTWMDASAREFRSTNRYGYSPGVFTSFLGLRLVARKEE